jgi:hypothetical protein
MSVIGVRVRNDGSIHTGVRVDVEITGFTVQTAMRLSQNLSHREIPGTSSEIMAKSRVNSSRIADFRSPSGIRKIAAGCQVAMVCRHQSVGRTCPRWFVTRKSRPNNVCAGVLPKHTTTAGSMIANSASIQGRHA